MFQIFILTNIVLSPELQIFDIDYNLGMGTKDHVDTHQFKKFVT